MNELVFFGAKIDRPPNKFNWASLATTNRNRQSINEKRPTSGIDRREHDSQQRTNAQMGPFPIQIGARDAVPIGQAGANTGIDSTAI